LGSGNQRRHRGAAVAKAVAFKASRIIIPVHELIYHNSAYRPSGYSNCVDDNSAESRCEGYYQWDRSAIDAEYTATDNQ
jgi:hypothetical protein